MNEFKFQFCFFIAFSFVGIFLTHNSHADTVNSVKGPVVLTVSGDIGVTNFKKHTEHHMSFFKHHEIAFNEAYQFDRDALLGFKQAIVKAKLPKGKKSILFSGPKLKDVLEKIKAAKKPVRFLALDGFAVQLSQKDIMAHDWILALNADGRPLGIGGRGPLWVVHSPTQGDIASEAEEQRWPWAVFYMEVIGN